MALKAYNSPGVIVQEGTSPSLAPIIAGPSLIAIVGEAAGAQSATERVRLDGTTPVTLRFTGVDDTSVVVRSSSSNEILDAGNYLLTEGTDPNLNIAGDEPWSITRVAAPTVSPTAANTAVGTLSGTYVYAYSFVNADGETGLSPVSASVTYNGTQAGDITGIAVDASTGNTTTARNLYRAKVTSGVTGSFNLIATIANNTATVATDNVSDATAASGASPKTGINDGDTVVVSYSYTDANYFEPTFFEDFNDVVDKYGDPFDASGNITSPLTFAARLAFQNGASEIIGLAAASGSDSDLSAAFAKLEDEDDVRIVTVASGSAGVQSALVSHVANMNSQGHYRQAVIGRDGSASSVDAATLQAAAKAYNDEAIILVSPAAFTMQNPVDNNSTVRVGAQYAAAGVAGMFAARDVQISLTRKALAGFNGVADKRTATQAALDSQAGLFVIQDKGGVLQVRHGVSTAVGNINTAEASVVRAKYEMAHRVQSILDSSIVGQVLDLVDAPLTIRDVVVGTLEQLLIEGAIDNYGSVTARVLDSDPTTVEVRYEYRPAYPINNIVVQFTINTTTGAFDLTASAA